MDKFLLNGLNFKEHKNTQKPPGNQEWQEEFVKLDQLKILMDKSNYLIINDDVFFKIEYKQKNKIIPKTSRFVFRDNINNVLDIPQKGMMLYYESEDVFKTVLSYKITLEEFNLFIDKIKILNQIYKTPMTKTVFESLKSDLQVIIKKVSLINNVWHTNKININDDEEISMVNFLIENNLKDTINKIFINTGIKVDIDDVDKLALITNKELQIIHQKLPHLINFVDDINALHLEYPVMIDELLGENSIDKYIIPEPSGKINKTIIGVIDSSCVLNESWSKFVISNITDIEDDKLEDTIHGSTIASIIISAPTLNESIDDNFGIFKIKHFGILSKGIDNNIGADYNFLKHKIKKIIEDNKDIKVWNLSFGAPKKIWSVATSPLGKVLDHLSKLYDCIFVVASGNDYVIFNNKSLNFPADSLNSLSVGAVESFGEERKLMKSKYSSLGFVSHFVKPEISHFGGESIGPNEILLGIANNKLINCEGTSYAAALVTRQIASMIEEGYEALDAKAKLINVANRETLKKKSSAFGTVTNFKNLNNDNSIEIRLSSSLVNHSPRYYPLDFKFANNISVTSCIYANTSECLGEEYSISSVETSIISYNKFWYELGFNTPEKTILTKSESKEKDQGFSKLDNENYLRYSRGKLFTTSKSIYDKNAISQLTMDKDHDTALRIRRYNLFNVTDTEPLKFSTSIIIDFDSNINKERFLTSNAEILISTDAIVDILRKKTI